MAREGGRCSFCGGMYKKVVVTESQELGDVEQSAYLACACGKPSGEDANIPVSARDRASVDFASGADGAVGGLGGALQPD